MWSKYGRSRKAARSNSFVPQPVSGVSSRSTRERIALAHFEARRLLPESWRSTRQPANSFTSVGDCARRASSFGMSARSEEHTSELQSLMRISYAVFCLKKKKNKQHE